MSLLNKSFNISNKDVYSVSQLEKAIMHLNKVKTKAFDKLPLNQNLHPLNVISPFYDKNKICKTFNCQCPYHKRVRIQAAKKMQIRKPKYFFSAVQSPSKYQEQEEYERLSHKQYLNIKQNTSIENRPKRVKHESFAKINSFNQEYLEFLKLHDQILLRKDKFGETQLHVIKTSVRKIFDYIFHHLDDSKEKIKDYIETLEKDRDMSHFYVERFVDLKKRKAKNAGIRKFIGNFQKKSFILYEQQKQNDELVQQQIKNQAEKIVKKENTDKIRAIKKIQTKKIKLVIENMINNIQTGNQIKQQHVTQFQELSLESLTQNCKFLRRKLSSLDAQILKQIKKDILLSTMQKIRTKEFLSKEQKQILQKKTNILNQLIEKIDQRIKEVQQEDFDSCQNHHLDRNQSKNSRRKISNRRNSKFISEFKKTNEQSCKTIEQSQYSEKNEQRIIEEGKSKSLISINQDQNGLNIDKTEKTKWSKFKRLSHGIIYQRRQDEEIKQQQNNIELKNIQDIGQMLQEMARDLNQNRKYIKEIEARLIEAKLGEFVLQQKDSLITIKRKIRVLKELITSETNSEMKHQIIKYVEYMEKTGLVKNRNWAFKKLKNMIMHNDESADIGEQGYQSPESILMEMIRSIVSSNAQLYFYLISQTQYEQEEVKLEAKLFEQIQRQMDKDFLKKKFQQSRMTLWRTRNMLQSTKVIIKQDEKQEDLIQVGLRNRFDINFCFQRSINQLQDPLRLEDHQPNTDDNQSNEILSLMKEFKRYFG